MQTKLHRCAAADPGRRFDDLFNFVHDPATLIVAFSRVAGNRGANTPGIDGVTAAEIEEAMGVPGFLGDLRVQLKAGTFTPLPVRAHDPQAGRVGKGAEAWHSHHRRSGCPGGAEARAGTYL
jgi:RNA-directed DNA polymerase